MRVDLEMPEGVGIGRIEYENGSRPSNQQVRKDVADSAKARGLPFIFAKWSFNEEKVMAS